MPNNNQLRNFPNNRKIIPEGLFQPNKMSIIRVKNNQSENIFKKLGDSSNLEYLNKEINEINNNFDNLNKEKNEKIKKDPISLKLNLEITKKSLKKKNIKFLFLNYFVQNCCISKKVQLKINLDCIITNSLKNFQIKH